MIIDGEKWACEACVRGHRVSNCQHSDRPLQHINKKGRPVSQCQHCRSMRKSRASHVKCDCGEKSHKCAHLQSTVDGHRDSCCCNHGGRCTCSHKKDTPQLDPVPESDSDEPEATAATTRTSSKASSTKGNTSTGVGRPRRRANTIHSDGMLSFDEHGRHRPTYKHVRAASKCDPYPLKRVNSMHSASSLSARSLDNADSGGCCSSAGTETTSTRRVKSETASPLMAGGTGFTQLNQQLTPLDLSGIDYPSYHNSGYDMFGGMEDPPMFSAGLSATSVDWSHYEGLDFAAANGGTFTPSSVGQAHSYAGGFGGAFEQAPTMTTTTTSGDVSEAEDFMGPTPDDYSNGFGYASSALDYVDEYTKLPKDASALAAAENTFTEDFFQMYDYSQAHGLPNIPDPNEANGLPWESQ